jgi:hypothetical protein
MDNRSSYFGLLQEMLSSVKALDTSTQGQRAHAIV